MSHKNTVPLKREELVAELEKFMVQETLSQYDINTPTVVRDGKVYCQVLHLNGTYTRAAGPVFCYR